MPSPARPPLDPLRAISLTYLVPGDRERERTTQVVPLSITWEDLGGGDGEWAFEGWDVGRDEPLVVRLRDVVGHVLTVEQARRLVVRFEWRAEGE